MAYSPAIPVRRPSFNWADVDVQHWIPGDTRAVHVLNAMHLLFPEGERAFCRVLGSALGSITDTDVRAAVQGFIAQEGAHAHAHAQAAARLRELNPNADIAKQRVEKILRLLLGKKRSTNRITLSWRLASVAAIEHITAALGEWAFTEERLAEHGADPRMVTLVKWHCAEEIEHRSVAFDAHAAVQRRGCRITRNVAMAFWAPTVVVVWLGVARTLAAGDANAGGKRVIKLRHLRRDSAEGLLPDITALLAGTWSFTRAGYHPATFLDPTAEAEAAAFLASNELQSLLVS